MILKRIAISIFDTITFRISLLLEPLFDALEYFLARRAVIASRNKEHQDDSFPLAGNDPDAKGTVPKTP